MLTGNIDGKTASIRLSSTTDTQVAGIHGRLQAVTICVKQTKASLMASNASHGRFASLIRLDATARIPVRVRGRCKEAI